MGRKSKIDIVETIINKMFEIAGHAVTYNDIIGRTDNWYQQWTMTQEQDTEWKEWGVAFLRKTKRWPKYLAEREMAMFSLCYGLKLEHHDKMEI